MGAGGSKTERATRSDKRSTGYVSQSINLRSDVPAQDCPSGVKLSWLVTQFHAPLNVDYDSTVSRVVEEFVSPSSTTTGPAVSADAFGPATHVVLVHPSTPWNNFLKAVLNHVRLDLKKALLAGEAPLSPRSPLLPFCPTASRPHSTVGGRCVDLVSWLNDGQGGPDSAYQLTYLHIDFFAGGTDSTTTSMGATATEHPLSRMTHPAALLVIDPAGAIFTDPKAVWAVGAAMSILRHPAGPKDPHRRRFQLSEITPAPTSDDSQTATAAAADRNPRLQLVSCAGTGDWAPVAAAFGRLAGVLLGDPAVVRMVVDGVLESARLQYHLYCPLLRMYDTHFSVGMDLDCAGLTPAEESLLPGQIVSREKNVRDDGPGSQSGIGKFPRGALEARAVAPTVPPTDAETISPARRSHSVTEGRIARSASARQMTLSGPTTRARASASPSSNITTMGAPAASAFTAAAAAAAAAAAGIGANSPVGALLANAAGSMPSCATRSTGGLSPIIAHALETTGSASAAGTGTYVLPSAASSRDQGGTVLLGYVDGAGIGSVGSFTHPDSMASYAVEAGRRYAALLDGMGLWAAAQTVLESCVGAAGERWGHRSAHMAALRSQLGRLQQLQGLHTAAEVTWRQALEALEASQGPESAAAMLGRVALSQVLASLRGSEAETMLRTCLASLDMLCGPTAAETLVAREALAGYLMQSGRWVEAEVSYQALLQALEGAPPSSRPGSSSQQPQLQQQQQQAVESRAASRQQLLMGAGPGQGHAHGVDTGGGGGSAGNSGASPRVTQRSDSRARLAWSMQGGDVAAGAPGEAAPGSRPGPGGSTYGGSAQGGLGQLRSSLPTLPPVNNPLAATTVSLPFAAQLAPLSLPAALAAGSRGASPPTSEVRSGGGFGRLGPGNADPLVWSGAAAALADVVSAVHRECGGVNELYDGMHLAGPEGSTGAELAAAAAVCPRSGACITAVVNVRRLTDAGALYDAALAVRRGAVDPAHTAMLDLQLQYARYLSITCEHSRAEAVCRAALQQLAAPQLGAAGGGSSPAAAAAAAAGAHPAEVAALQTLGDVLRAAGSLAAATTVLSSAVAVSERLATAGDMAPADARRIEALDALAEVLWQRATAAQAGGEAQGGPAAAAAAAGRSYIARAMEYKRQATELMSAVCGEHHEKVMRGWVALGQMMEAAGDLPGAERAFESAAEVALHRHSRLSAATKAIFRQLQRVYQAQGRTEDAKVLGHMYRLKGGLLSNPLSAGGEAE